MMSTAYNFWIRSGVFVRNLFDEDQCYLVTFCIQHSRLKSNMELIKHMLQAEKRNVFRTSVYQGSSTTHVLANLRS